jgi:hypothetical protein
MISEVKFVTLWSAVDILFSTVFVDIIWTKTIFLAFFGV